MLHGALICRDRRKFTMGMVASQARLTMLTARKSDLELQGQFINQARMQLSNMSSTMMNSSSNLEPDSPQAQQLQSRIAAMQQVDKSLEMQLRRVDTQHQAVQTEIESVQKVISKNIEMSFKTFSA
jgi:DNA repair ATPase RecN